MKGTRKRGDFMELPVYPGGKKALIEYIHKNLKYPKEALINNIEGKILVTYDVNADGKVVSANVKNSLGYGCDEEAIRLVKLLKYRPSSTKKLRVSAKMSVAINFKLPRTKLQYNYVSEKKQTAPEKKKENNSIIYTIKVGKA